MKKLALVVLLLFCISLSVAAEIDISYTPGSQYFPGFITVSVSTPNTAVIVYQGDEPRTDTFDTRGNILFFDVIENPSSINIPVPEEFREQPFTVKVGAEQTTVMTSNTSKISKYTLPSGITVYTGAPLPVLPDKISVTLDDGNSVSVAVTWDAKDYRPTVGTYTVYGTITKYPLTAGLAQPSIKITVIEPLSNKSGGGGGSSAPSKEEPAKTSETPVIVLPVHISRIVRFKIGENRFILDEDIYMMDTPIIYNDKGDRTLFPVRFLPAALGYDVNWDPAESKVTISSSARTLVLTIGSNILYINDIPTIMDTPAVIMNNRTYIPLRYVAEALNFKVDFNLETQVVTLTETD